jgi:CspA family cold shock protein
MSNGTIKWFNPIKGYGFIKSDETHKDVFVHFSELQMDGFKTVREKMDVVFELNLTERGPIAKQVRLAPEADGPAPGH